MKKILIAMVMTPIMAFAEKEIVGGVEWTYHVENGNAILGCRDEETGGYRRAIDPCVKGKISIPSMLGGHTVVSIGDFAFERCGELMEVELTSNITSIGSCAFSGCRALTSMAIPSSVANIGEGAFYGCDGLTAVSISYGVLNIGDDAFRNCTGLTSITIPGSVTNIEGYAFYGCSGLESVEISSSVISIGPWAFYCCSGIKSVTIPEWVFQRMPSIFPSAYQTITYVAISEGTTKIRSFAVAYSECESVVSVTIPSSVTDIGEGAFYGCSNLVSVILSDGLKNIGRNAFRDCRGLSSLTIPSTVTNIGECAFLGCAGMTDLKLFSESMSIGREAFRGCCRLASADGFVIVEDVLYDYFGKEMSVILPAGIKCIGYYAFSSCSELESVVISGGVTNIGYGAFSGCKNLTSVTIPPSVTNVGDWAFDGCHNLTRIVVEHGDLSRVWGMLIAAGLYCTSDVFVEACAMPVVAPSDGSVFNGDGCQVTIACATEGADIYYSTNGRTPRTTEAYRYKGPFTISDTVTIVAVAVKGEKMSEYVEVTITKVIPEPLTLAGVLDEPKLADVTTGGDAEWLPIEDETAKVGGSCAVSGALDESDEEMRETWLEAKVYGKGTLTFWWRVSCEPDPRGRYSYDFAAFEADDVVIARKDDETDWVQVTKTFATDGEHVVRWSYNTDGWPCEDYDGCVWVDGVTWSGAAAPEESPKPTIEGDVGATVTGDAEAGFVVRPSDGNAAVAVTIPQGVDAAKVTVEVSPKVASVKLNGAKVKVLSGGVDITEFLNVPTADGNGVIDLTKATVKQEIVKEAMDPKRGAKIVLEAANPSLTTSKTRVGLFYQLREGATLGGMKDGDSKVGDGQPWTPEIKVKGGNSAFYSIEVGKGE